MQSLKTTRQFSYVYKKGVKRHHEFFVLYCLPLEHLHREFLGAHASLLGLSVSKKVGNAVRRNLIKRRVRSIFQHVPLQCPQAIVFVAKAGVGQLDYATLRTHILQCLAQKKRIRTKVPK
ncbi:ribonuclease P protein component [Helicobacter baculiformis]|uniref:Ribonuclease P protein component n=1 Tax=Helicobacter baculiformis TaxID=427351 RepID=A0ABV7ZEG6_9HELI|nr:ribonuclease P protein component [Helicobacter baculiformis]